MAQVDEQRSPEVDIDQLRAFKGQLIEGVDNLPEMKGSWRKPIKVGDGISVTLPTTEHVSHDWCDGGIGQKPVNKEGTMFTFKVDKKKWGHMIGTATTEEDALDAECFPDKGNRFSISLDKVNLEHHSEAAQILKQALEGVIAKMKEGNAGRGTIREGLGRVFGN